MIARWVRIVVNYRWIVIITIFLVTLFAAYEMKNLYFYNRLTDWLPKEDPGMRLFIETSKKFSINEMILIIIRPDVGVFNRDILKRVQRLTDTLEEKNEVFSVTSLANISDIKKIEGGIEVANLLDWTPQTDAALVELKKYVLNKEVYRNRVVSADGQWLALTVSLQERSDIIRTVGDIIIPQTEKIFGGRGRIYYTGMPADGHYVNLYTKSDQKTLVPIMVLLIVIILYFSFRTGKGIFYPLLVVLTANVWLFGLIGYLKRPLTIIMPAVPVLLIALGSAYALYILNKIQHDFDPDAPDKKKLIAVSCASVIVPILFAAFTDIAGFLACKTVPLTLIADFGIFSALGLFFALIIALSLVPALATFASFSESKKIAEHRVSRLLDRCGDMVIRRPLAILLVSLTVMVLVGSAMLRMKIEVGFTEFYPKRSQPRQGITEANRHFDGAYPLSLVFKGPDCKSPEMLRLIRHLESGLYALPQTSKPLSIVYLVSELNFQLNDTFALPETSKAVSNLWFFMEGRRELDQILAKDEKETLVLTKITEPTTRFNTQLNKTVAAFIKRETASGFASYKLSDFAPEARERIRRAEAGYLAEEIASIARRYLDRPPAAAVISRTLWESWQAPLATAEKQSELEKTWSQYLNSPEFEFALAPAAAKRIVQAICLLSDANRLEPAAIVDLLKRNVDAKEYDDKMSAFAAASLIYKGNETLRHLRVRSIWHNLQSLLPADDGNFQKQVHSALYDLADDLAVLPADMLGGLSGSRPLDLEKVDYTGLPVLLTKLAEFLFNSLLQSIAMAYLITLLMMIIMRRRWALGFISTIPIIFTAVMMYGFLGMVNLPLDYATMMIGAISIGVGIDYTIHFIYVVTDEIQRGRSIRPALKIAFVERGKAIISNSAAVMAGFAVLMLSSMKLLANFGRVMVLSMFIASVAALTILPAAILVFKPRLDGKKKEIHEPER